MEPCWRRPLAACGTDAGPAAIRHYPAPAPPARRVRYARHQRRHLRRWSARRAPRPAGGGLRTGQRVRQGGLHGDPPAPPASTSQRRAVTLWISGGSDPRRQCNDVPPSPLYAGAILSPLYVGARGVVPRIVTPAVAPGDATGCHRRCRPVFVGCWTT